MLRAILTVIVITIPALMTACVGVSTPVNDGGFNASVGGKSMPIADEAAAQEPGAGVAPESGMGGAPAFPPGMDSGYSTTRSASDSQLVVLGKDYTDSSPDGVTSDGDAVSLTADAGEYAWAMFGVDGLTTERPTSLHKQDSRGGPWAAENPAQP